MLFHIPEASLVDQAEPKLRKAGKSEETDRSTQCSRGSISVKLPYMHIHYKICKDVHPRIFTETVFVCKRKHSSQMEGKFNGVILITATQQKSMGLKIIKKIRLVCSCENTLKRNCQMVTGFREHPACL